MSIRCVRDKGCAFRIALFRYGVALTCVFSVTGCCLFQEREFSDPGFLPYSDELSRSRSRHIPFDYWYVPNEERLNALVKERKTVCVLPVNTEIVEEQARALELPQRWFEGRKRELRELAKDLEVKSNEAIKKFTSSDTRIPAKEFHPHAVCEYPGPDSLVWELALVEVVPNVPVLSVFGIAANHFFYGTGLVSALGSGAVTIEGVLRDGDSHDPLLIFRERQGDKITLFSVRNFTVYGHTRKVFSEVAEQMALLTSTTTSYEIPRSWRFTFNPF